MKLSIIILSVLVGYLQWSDRRLTEDDFNISYSMKGDELAVVCTGIYLVNNHAIAIQDKSQSFISYRASRDKIPYILAHEQLHFDITEYIVRQLNKQLRVFSNRDSIYNVYLAKRDSMQDLYDKETQHSMDTLQQRQWTLKMKSLLITK